MLLFNRRFIHFIQSMRSYWHISLLLLRRLRAYTLTISVERLFIIIRAVTNVVRYDPGSHYSVGIQTHDMCVWVDKRWMITINVKNQSRIRIRSSTLYYAAIDVCCLLIHKVKLCVVFCRCCCCCFLSVHRRQIQSRIQTDGRIFVFMAFELCVCERVCVCLCVCGSDMDKKNWQ